jgi:hypothetical protein
MLHCKLTAVKSVYLVLTLAMLVACQVHSTQRSHNVAVSNANFKKIELDSDTQNACSPDVTNHSDFIGIVINAPTDVEFDVAERAEDGSFTVIPICGYYQLSLLELRKDSVIQLFAMNIETQDVYRGELIEEDPGSDEPFPFDVPEPEPEEIEGQLLSAYFNPNFARFVSLPTSEATYKILVQIGQAKSNIVELKVQRKE